MDNKRQRFLQGNVKHKDILNILNHSLEEGRISLVAVPSGSPQYITYGKYQLRDLGKKPLKVIVIHMKSKPSHPYKWWRKYGVEYKKCSALHSGSVIDTM